MKRDKNRAPESSELRELLARSGLRVTGQRVLILGELARLRVPASHTELTERLAGSALDRATIYRNLVAMTEAGLLVRAQLGDGVWRYELPRVTQSEHGSHPHFVCTDCGEVECLPSSAVSLHGQAVRNEVAEVQLRGRCAACARVTW